MAERSQKMVKLRQMPSREAVGEVGSSIFRWLSYRLAAFKTNPGHILSFDGRFSLPEPEDGSLQSCTKCAMGLLCNAIVLTDPRQVLFLFVWGRQDRTVHQGSSIFSELEAYPVRRVPFLLLV